MPRSEARIAVSIWDDDDFLALTAGAQRMFMFLLSQRDLAHTGVLALRERRWSRKARGLNVKLVVDALDELVAGRFIVMDEEAEELLIRSFIRRDKVYRQPNVLRAAADQLETVSSPQVLAALAEELRRVASSDDIQEAAAGIVAEMLAIIGDPKPNPSPEGSRRGSEDRPQEPAGATPASPSAESRPEGVSDGGHSEGAFGQIGLVPDERGSGNPSEEATRGTPGERGDVTYLEVSPRVPGPRAPDPEEPPPLRGGALRLVDDLPPLEGELLDAGAAVAVPEPNAGQLLGAWIDYVGASGVTLTPGLKGRYGKAIKAQLAAGFTVEEIKVALAKMLADGVVGRPNYLEARVVEARRTGRTARRLTPGERTVANLTATAPAGADLLAHFFGSEAS